VIPFAFGYIEGFYICSGISLKFSSDGIDVRAIMTDGTTILLIDKHWCLENERFGWDVYFPYSSIGYFIAAPYKEEPRVEEDAF